MIKKLIIGKLFDLNDVAIHTRDNVIIEDESHFIYCHRRIRVCAK